MVKTLGFLRILLRLGRINNIWNEHSHCLKYTTRPNNQKGAVAIHREYKQGELTS